MHGIVAVVTRPELTLADLSVGIAVSVSVSLAKSALSVLVLLKTLFSQSVSSYRLPGFSVIIFHNFQSRFPGINLRYNM